MIAAALTVPANHTDHIAANWIYDLDGKLIFAAATSPKNIVRWPIFGNLFYVPSIKIGLQVSPLFIVHIRFIAEG